MKSSVTFFFSFYLVYKAFQGEFTIVEVNKDPGLAVFLDAYSDPTSLEYKILENRVCGSVSMTNTLQSYLTNKHAKLTI